jgi:hypothetical protein
VATIDESVVKKTAIITVDTMRSTGSPKPYVIFFLPIVAISVIDGRADCL